MKKKMTMLFLLCILGCMESKDGYKHAVGDAYQGGIIVYILKPGDRGFDPNVTHGLIQSMEKCNEKACFGCISELVKTDVAIGSGTINTDLLARACNQSESAAMICAQMKLNGYSDWFLPSIQELSHLVRKESNVAYLSSSSDLGTKAWVRCFHYYEDFDLSCFCTYKDWTSGNFLVEYDRDVDFIPFRSF